MSTWLTAVIPFAGLGIVAAVVLLRARHRRRLRVPGLDVDGEPLRPEDMRAFRRMWMAYHAATAAEPVYGRTEGAE